MKNITVTVFQDGAGYYEAGYPKTIGAAGLTVIARETVRYGAVQECISDPAQPSKLLLHISVPGVGNLWVDDTQATIADKLNGTCCAGAGGGAGIGAWITKSSSVTLSSSETTIKADATSSNIVLTLPAAAGTVGIEFTIKKIDATTHTVTIGGAIDGATNYVISTQNVSISLVSDGTSYYIV